MVGKKYKSINPLRRAFTVALAGAVLAPLAVTLPVQRAKAADFKHAKKIIVPPTRIPRRYDYDSMGGRVAKPSQVYYQNSESSTYSNPDLIKTGSSSSSSSRKKRSGKLELVPPPPPVAPSLLPSSLTSDVPPPPPAMTSRTRTSPGSRRFSPHAKRFSSPGNASVSSNIVNRANSLASQGHLKDAQELLIKNATSHAKDQSFVDALEKISNDRAKYYLRKDNYSEAAKQARIALNYAPRGTESKSLLNQALRHQGIDPLNSDSRLAEARKLFTQARYDQARVEYMQAGFLKPSAEAEIGLGNIAFRKGDFTNAKVRYQKALDLAPHSSVAMRQLGITRYKLTDVVGANADLTRALVQDPGDKLARDNLVDLWQRQVAMRPNDANSHLGLARAYQLAGELKEAQAEYRTVVKIDPNHPNLPAARQSFKLALARQQAKKAYDAGKTLESHGAIQEAFDKASEAVRLSPGDVRYQIFQATLLEKLGDLNGARGAYLHILSLDPKNSIAASRVKALNMISPTGQNGQPLKATALPLGVPQYRGEGPALPYLPGPYKNGAYQNSYKVPSADPVQNMTGFLGSLRNLMLAQKKVLKADEEQVMQGLGLSSSSSSSSSSLPSLPKIDSSVPSLDTSKLIKSDDVKALLDKAKEGTSPSSTEPATNTASTANAASGGGSNAGTGSAAAPQSWQEMAINAGQSLVNDTRLQKLGNLAAQAAPAIIDKRITPEAASNIYEAIKPANNSTTTGSSAKPDQAQSIQSAPAKASPAPPVVRSSKSIPPLAPPINRGPGAYAPEPQTQLSANSYNKLGELEVRNKQLLSQLTQAKQELQALKSGNGVGATGQAQMKNQGDEEITETVQAEIENRELAAAPGRSPNSPLVSHIDHEAPLRGAIEPAAKPTATTERVHLELLGVKAARKDIKLKVRLRNERNTDLLIPNSKKAVLRIAGNEDQFVPIKFPRKKLAPHSVMEGYIKVPGTRLSPAADVFIPELAGSSQEDSPAGNVHLTVPISSLNTNSH